jgi:peptidoglycan hydrolase-like protein with peptidoglycan-binding domain
MLHVVQAGSGDRRPLVIGYFIGNHAAYVAGLPPEACILADIDNPAGRVTHPPGKGGVDPLDVVVTFARQNAGAFDPSAVVRVGWSAGCEAVREQLRAGASPDAVVCLDGVAGSLQPTEAQQAPWRALVARARASEALFVLSRTSMTYMEHLPGGQAFASTTRLAELLTGTTGSEPPASGDITPADGELYVLGYPSGDIDGAAHIRQQTEVLPDVMRRIVAPWLAARAAGATAATPPPAEAEPPISASPPTVPARRTSVAPGGIAPTPLTSRDLRAGLRGPDVIAWERWLDLRGFLGMAAPPITGDFDQAMVAGTRRMQNAMGLEVDGVLGDHTRAQAKAWPAPMVKADDGSPTYQDHSLSLGACAVRWALQYAGREDLERLGPNASAEITTWLGPATRRATGTPLGLSVGEWCAAFFCASADAVSGPGEAIPHGYRAAGVELVADAKENGSWRDVGLVRAGAYTPAEGDGCILQRGGQSWETHTCRVFALSPGGFWTVGGNESNTVRITFHHDSDPTILGFIAYGG